MRTALAIVLLAGLCQAQTPAAEPLMTVKAIEIVAVAEAEVRALRSRLPIREGSLVRRADLGAAAKALREMDAFLMFSFLATDRDGAQPEVTIRIAPWIQRATVYMQEPVLLKRVEPDNVDALREQGISGSVEIGATIGLNGTVRDVEIFAGNPVLADAASKAVLQWQYRPALADTQPIEVRRNIALRFSPLMPPSRSEPEIKR